MQKVITINLLDIIKIVLSKKDSYSNKGGLKYFIGYDDYNVSIITLCAILPQMNAEVKYFDNIIEYCINYKFIQQQIW